MAKIKWIHLPVDLHPAQFVKILNLNKTLCNWTQSGWEETSLIERELLERCSINLTTILSYLSYICLLKVFFSKLAAVLWWSLASLAAYRELHQKLDIYIREFEEVYCALLPFFRITVCLMIISFGFLLNNIQDCILCHLGLYRCCSSK